MEERKIIKQNIKTLLPYGGLTQIKKAILDKKQKSVSVSQVKLVLNPELNRWDDDIIEEAQIIVADVQKGIIAAKERMV